MARDDVGLWAVADGMGGHRGGEVASAIACDALGRNFADHTIDGLIEAIEQANQAVYETGAGDPDLTGMGTTMVALAVVDDEGEEVLAIANVGDSRVYRYSVGELDQLTDDHSLVADLVREGSLSPEEAAVHPQRNIVTRVLGVNDGCRSTPSPSTPWPATATCCARTGCSTRSPSRASRPCCAGWTTPARRPTSSCGWRSRVAGATTSRSSWSTSSTTAGAPARRPAPLAAVGAASGHAGPRRARRP